MKRWIFFLIFPLILFAQERREDHSLECEELSYDSTTGLFKGNRAVLIFNDGTSLSCKWAEFDRGITHGAFYSGICDEYALFQGKINGGASKEIPFTIRCRKFAFKNYEQECDLTAEDDVHMDCGEEYSASADCATYHFHHANRMQGTLHLTSDGDAAPCEILSKSGDKIQGKQAWCDFSKHEVKFESAKGALMLPKSHLEKLNFSARLLTWYELKGRLWLSRDVIVGCNGLGLLCGDHAVLDYAQGTWTPEKVQMNGNVRMCNQFASKSEAGSPLDQYALADTAIYDTQTKKLKLIAKQGRRVLFYDKANHLKISAPKVEISENKEVKGCGDVRFTFADHEMEKLRSQFPKNF